MATKEAIWFDFSTPYIPPWLLADYELIYLPFPSDSERVRNPLSPEYSFFNLPKEAFDESGQNLICFVEKRWMGTEVIGHRPLPALPVMARSLRPELFSHLELVDQSPETLRALLENNGLVIAPLYNSQHRFIDARFQSSDYPYAEQYVLGKIDEDEEDMSDTLLDLNQATDDIVMQRILALYGSDDNGEPYFELCGGSLIESVALSEYARRVWCRTGGCAGGSGGILSYYEVLLTVRGLFRAMQTIIDFSIAGNSITKLEEQLRARSEERTATTPQRFALDTLTAVKGKAAERSNAALNISELAVREAFDFLQLFITSTTGARAGSVNRKSAPITEAHSGIAVKTPKFSEPVHYFYYQNEPRYLQDRYCEGSFGAGLAAQFMATLADPAPWKRCDNPECKAFFKHHFSTTGRTNDKATSCSPKCSTRKRNRLYNLEASAVRTAIKRYNNTDEVVAYIEKRLAGEIPLTDLPKARRRWRNKTKTNKSTQ
jgi:hypothetical protein